jgi:ABC-type glycerol-3-phosphate transport system substrate-binding protein
VTVRRLVGLCLAVAALLSACGPPAPLEEPAVITFAIPVTLTVVLLPVPGLPDRSADYQRLADAFHDANPEITVQLKSVGLDELPQDLTGASFLTDPEWGVDVILASADLLPALVQAGLIRDLQPALDTGQPVQAEDFLSPVLDLLRWQGSAYGLPVEVDPWVTFYNRDLFDAAGVPYPLANWRWDGFLTTARALGASGVVRFPFGSWGAQVTPFVYQNGSAVVDDPLAPTAATLLDPATVEAVRWYTDLALAEGVMSTPADLAGYAVGAGRRQTIIRAGDEAETAAAQAQADLEQAIASGDVAMWLGRLSERGGRWERWDFAWGAAPLAPGRQAATLAGVQACFVTAHSKYPNQAWQWIETLTRQPPLHGGLPARRSVAEGDAARTQLGQEVEVVLDDLLLALESGAVLPESLDWQAARWLGGPLFAVLAGEQTVEEALAAAQQRAEAELGQKER